MTVSFGLCVRALLNSLFFQNADGWAVVSTFLERNKVSVSPYNAYCIMLKSNPLFRQFEIKVLILSVCVFELFILPNRTHGS